MLRTPIQKDGELICPCGCGVVLQSVEERPVIKTPDYGTSSIAMELLGSSFKDVKFFSKRDRDDITYEKALTRLAETCKKYSLPEELAVLVMKRIKHNEKGLFSHREQVRQLLKMLARDDYYVYWKKIELIKKDYENISGI